jgi:hypothetical protein
VAMILRLAGVNAVSGGVLNLNGANSGMASIAVLNEWAPRVARHARQTLGGDVYENTAEAIPLRIYGSTRLQCLDALEALAAAMNQASEWRAYGNTGAVVLEHAVDGTTLANPLQAAVLDSPLDAADLLSLPITYNKFLQGYEVNPVTLPLLRRGLWLGEAETEEDLLNTTDPVFNIAFADDLANPSPVSLELIYDDTGDVTFLSVGMLAVSDVEEGIQVASTYASGSAGSTVSSDRSFGGEHREVTPSSVTTYTVNLDLDGGVIDLNPRRPELFEVFLVGRNLSDSVTYQVTGQLYSEAQAPGDLGSVRVIPVGSSAFMIRLGVLGCAASLKYLRVRLVPSTTDTDKLHIDYAVLCKLGTQLISFPRSTEMSSVQRVRVIQGQLDGDGIGSGAAVTSLPKARVESLNYISTVSPIPVQFPTAHGNKSLWMQGDALQVCIFGHAASRVIDSTSYANVTDFLISRSLTVARRPGYLVPR